MNRRRLLLAGVVLNLVLAAVALGWLAWISTAPRYWFPDAFAAKGPTGDQGRRGPVGPAGPTGPVGPDAADAIDSLESEISDLTDRVVTLETDLAALQEESGGSTLETDLQDVTQKINDICDELSSYGGALGDIYLAAC